MIATSLAIFTARCYAKRGYAMLSRLSVCSSVCPFVTFRYRDHKLKDFENTFTADYLRVHVQADPNISDLVQRPKLRWNSGRVQKICNV